MPNQNIRGYGMRWIVAPVAVLAYFLFDQLIFLISLKRCFWAHGNDNLQGLVNHEATKAIARDGEPGQRSSIESPLSLA